MTRRLALALVCFLLAPALPVGAQRGIDSGGGVRGSGDIRVRDGLGFPAAGVASAQTVQAASGLIPGLPAATPVDLTSFSLQLTDDGILLRWEGNSDRRIYGFFLGRAEWTGGAVPADDAYERVDATFAGWGPHEYTDRGVLSGVTYYYRLEAIWAEGGREVYGPWTIRLDDAPRGFVHRVLPVEPNPFREAFVLRFSLGQETTVGWSLHDVRGRVVSGGAYGRLPEGYHAYTVRPRQRLAAGVYFLTVQAGAVHDVQKLVSLP